MNGSARQKLRILILDDYAVVRRGIRQILASEFGPVQFGEGKAGPEGRDLALGQPWDLVIVVVDLPDREALEVLAELKRMRPDLPILVFIGRVKFRGAVGAVTAGTEDNVEGAADPRERGSAAAGVPADSTSGQLATATDVPPDPEPRPRRLNYESLSSREREVLRLFGLGRTVKEIAARLALSEKTVSTYRNRMLTKLGLQSTADLIRYAALNHLPD
jgi:DNA-binding NarL/FixJ family response regulator